MYLGDVFRGGHQGRHGPKGIALEIHVESGYHYPHPFIGEIVADRNDLVVKELCLIYPDYIAILRKHADMTSSGYGRRPDLVLIVGDHPFIAVSGIDDGFEDLHLLSREFCALQPSDEFFRLTRKHGPADHFYPPKLFFMINSVFEKHFVILDEIRAFPVSIKDDIKVLKKTDLYRDANQKEMKRKLKEELVKLSTEIITSQDAGDIPELYEKAKNLYEKLAVLKFIEEKLSDIEIDISKNVIASKFEKMASAVIDGNRAVPENNPHEEDIMTPGIDTIKHMVSEMPKDLHLEQLFAEFVAKAEVMKNDVKEVTPEVRDIPKQEKPKSLNDKLTTREIVIGLNDRLAFVKHLFNDSTEEFNRVLSQLNTIESADRSLAFIENMVKPEYDHWKGKEEYASRFMALIARRFS